jgi:acylphosphatase
MAEQDQTQVEGRLHATVYGQVQGVSFRAYTFQKALELGLTGWIRNVPDGHVETLAEGRREQLEAFLAFLHRGSPSAIVTGVDAEWQEPTGEFADFRVRHFYIW